MKTKYGSGSGSGSEPQRERCRNLLEARWGSPSLPRERCDCCGLILSNICCTKGAEIMGQKVTQLSHVVRPTQVAPAQAGA